MKFLLSMFQNYFPVRRTHQSHCGIKLHKFAQNLESKCRSHKRSVNRAEMLTDFSKCLMTRCQIFDVGVKCDDFSTFHRKRDKAVRKDSENQIQEKFYKRIFREKSCFCQNIYKQEHQKMLIRDVKFQISNTLLKVSNGFCRMFLNRSQINPVEVCKPRHYQKGCQETVQLLLPFSYFQLNIQTRL